MGQDAGKGRDPPRSRRMPLRRVACARGVSEHSQADAELPPEGRRHQRIAFFAWTTGDATLAHVKRTIMQSPLAFRFRHWPIHRMVSARPPCIAIPIAGNGSPRAGATLLKAIGCVRVSFLAAKSEGQIPQAKSRLPILQSLCRAQVSLRRYRPHRLGKNRFPMHEARDSPGACKRRSRG